MKPHELIGNDIIQNSFGPRTRIDKQVSAIRRILPDAFPRGKKGKQCAEVTALDAARLLVMLMHNPNPYDLEQVGGLAAKICTLRPFLNDLASILENHGLSLRGHRVKEVFICLERPFARIEFEGGKENIYGETWNAKAFEKFAVITSQVLQDLAHLQKTSPKSLHYN